MRHHGSATLHKLCFVRLIIVVLASIAVLECLQTDLLLANQNSMSELAASASAVVIVACLAASLRSLSLTKNVSNLVDTFFSAARQALSGNFSIRIEYEPNAQEQDALISEFNRIVHTFELRDRTQKQWLKDLSHELRTPLAVLQAEFEAIQDGIHKCDSNSIDSLHRELINLISVVENMSDLAKSDMDELKFHFQATDLIQLLKQTLNEYSGKLQAKQLKVDCSDILQEQCVASVDDVRLRQVFVHLLENAITFTDAGGTIKISGKQEDGKFHFSMEDSFPPVPEQALARIFDRFYRLDESRNRGSGGAGLGLALSKVIVSEHGGTIQAVPSGLGGLKLEVNLPLIQNVGLTE